jgi:hypothetical protein
VEVEGVVCGLEGIQLADRCNKTRVMPFIPTKSVACMSMSWFLGNVYMAKSCKGKKQDPDNPTLEKILVTKTEEAIAGYFSW